MLRFGPNSHLDETHQREEGHRHALSHDREAEPGAQLQEGKVNISISSVSRQNQADNYDQTRYLICIVWTGHQQEDPGEGVLGGVGDLPGFRAWVKIVKERKYKNAVQMLNQHIVQWLFGPGLLYVGTWWAEIPQSNVDGKVANLAELRKQASLVPGPYRVKWLHFKANWLFLPGSQSNGWIYNSK